MESMGSAGKMRWLDKVRKHTIEVVELIEVGDIPHVDQILVCATDDKLVGDTQRVHAAALRDHRLPATMVAMSIEGH